jgi:hypothetical protein
MFGLSVKGGWVSCWHVRLFFSLVKTESCLDHHCCHKANIWSVHSDGHPRFLGIHPRGSRERDANSGAAWQQGSMFSRFFVSMVMFNLRRLNVIYERSKACTCLRSLGSSDRGFESHSGHGCLVCVCAFFCLCTGRGLAMSWSPAQGVLPTVYDSERNRSETESFMEVGQGPLGL